MTAMKLLKAAAFLVAGILLLSFIWSIGSSFIATRYPFWAWSNGSAGMQEQAIPEIVSQIRLGENVARVIERLGAGSANGQNNGAFTARLGYGGQLNFGIRSEANIGIIVTYRNGQVEKIESYR